MSCSSRVPTRLLAALAASFCVLLVAEASYYDILGVQKTADQVHQTPATPATLRSHRSHMVEQAAIKRAYRKRAIKWHPDKVPHLALHTLRTLSVFWLAFLLSRSIFSTFLSHRHAALISSHTALVTASHHYSHLTPLLSTHLLTPLLSTHLLTPLLSPHNVTLISHRSGHLLTPLLSSRNVTLISPPHTITLISQRYSQLTSSHRSPLTPSHCVLLQNPNRKQLAEDKFREIAEAYEVGPPIDAAPAPARHTACS